MDEKPPCREMFFCLYQPPDWTTRDLHDCTKDKGHKGKHGAYCNYKGVYVENDEVPLRGISK